MTSLDFGHIIGSICKKTKRNLWIEDFLWIENLIISSSSIPLCALHHSCDVLMMIHCKNTSPAMKELLSGSCIPTRVRVMVVDDDPISLHLVTAMLQRNNYMGKQWSGSSLISLFLNPGSTALLDSWVFFNLYLSLTISFCILQRCLSTTQLWHVQQFLPTGKHLTSSWLRSSWEAWMGFVFSRSSLKEESKLPSSVSLPSYSF